MSNKIYTVTFSPSLDYFVRCNDFKIAKVNRTDGSEYIFPGGKGINVSVMLKNLGYESTALGFIAGFTGKAVEEMVLAYGIETDFIEVPGVSRINVKMRTGFDETELNGQGAQISDADIEKLIEKLEKVEEDGWIVVAGNVNKRMPSDVYEKILRRLENKKLHIVVDTTDELLKHVLKYHPFLVKPNLEELSHFFDRKIEKRSEIFLFAEKLREMGAKNVIVSMGEKGACMVDESGKRTFVPAPVGMFVNSIGSGDSLVAGFIAGYLKYDQDYVKAFKQGVAAGSASAFTETIAKQDAVLALLQAME